MRAAPGVGLAGQSGRGSGTDLRVAGRGRARSRYQPRHHGAFGRDVRSTTKGASRYPAIQYPVERSLAGDGRRAIDETRRGREARGRRTPWLGSASTRSITSTESCSRTDCRTTCGKRPSAILRDQALGLAPIRWSGRKRTRSEDGVLRNASVGGPEPRSPARSRHRRRRRGHESRPARRTRDEAHARAP